MLPTIKIGGEGQVANGSGGSHFGRFPLHPYGGRYTNNLHPL